MKLIKICFVLIVFTLFLVLPQISISGYVLETITSKFIYFFYACSGLLGLYILYIVCDQKKIFYCSKLDLVLFALLSYITLNRYAIQNDFGFSIRYIELLGLSLLYVVLRSIALKNYPWLLLAIVISAILQAVYGNLQLLGLYSSNHSGFKITGSFFNPGPYAGFLVSVWPITLGMYLFKDRIITQVQSQTKFSFLISNEFIKQTFECIPLLGLISIAIVLPATQSRAAWIAAVSSGLVLLELRYIILKNLFKRANAFKGTVFIVLTIGLLSAGLFGMYHFKKGSSDGRAFIWKLTAEMIADTPVFGVGFDRFKAHYMNYQANYFAKNGETTEAMVADNTYYAFNEWLQFVVENGFLGVVFLMIIILVFFKTKVSSADQYWVLIAKTGLLSIGVFASLSYPMQILPIKLILIFLLTMLANSNGDTYQLKILSPNHSPKKNGTIGTITISVLYKLIIVLLTSISMFLTFSYTQNLSQGFVKWESALIKHQYGDYKGAITTYESVYPVFKKDGDFLMNYGKTLTIAGEYPKAIEVLEQAKRFLNTTIIETSLGDSYKAIKQYDKAEATYLQGANMIPSQFYPNYLLAKLYDDSGQEIKAVAMANKLIHKEIKIPSTAIKEIKGEMRKILVKYKNPLGFKN